MAQASQSPPPAATPPGFPVVLERAGRIPHSCALDRFRQQTYNVLPGVLLDGPGGGAARGGCNVD